jgi:hypothetical protein
VDFLFSALLVKIAAMIEKIKKMSLLVLTVILSMIWAVSSFNNKTFFQNHISMYSECSEAADPSENFRPVCCTDDVLIHDSAVKSKIFNLRDGIVPVLEVNLSNNYFQNFWQPPKLFNPPV